MWNQRDLNGPPLMGCEGYSKNLDIKSLKKTIEDAYNYFSVQDNFKSSIAYCENIVKLKKAQFRQIKAYHFIKKTNIALKRYTSLNITRIFENVLSFIPDYYEENKTLPSKQYFEYVLIRLQGLVKILIRVIECSTAANELLLRTLATAHFVELNTILIATMSQIWSLATDICKASVKIYNEIFLLKDFLPNKNNWLPKDYVLPDKLEVWLGDDWKNIINKKITQDKSTALTFYDELILQDDDAETDRTPKIKENPVILATENKKRVAKVNKVIEIGEEIDRNDFKRKKV